MENEEIRSWGDLPEDDSAARLTRNVRRRSFVRIDGTMLEEIPTMSDLKEKRRGEGEEQQNETTTRNYLSPFIQLKFYFRG